VAIVEALLYIDEPLSAVQIGKVFGSGQGCRESNVRYHLNHLAEVGVLEVDPFSHRRGGDPKQKFFYFARLPPRPG
jgi:repressor of nif and glnA expression